MEEHRGQQPPDLRFLAGTLALIELEPRIRSRLVIASRAKEDRSETQSGGRSLRQPIPSARPLTEQRE